MNTTGTMTRSFGAKVVFVAVAAILLGGVHTRLAAQEDNDLAARALRLKDNWHAVAPTDLAAARSALHSELNTLEEYLSYHGVDADWKAYLDWNVLSDELAGDADPDPEKLQTVYQKFTADYVGLEQRCFTRVAESLRYYIGLLTASAFPDAAEYHAALTDSLAATLSVYDSDSTAEHTHIIADGVAWLEQTEQGADLVRDIRKHYSHPNLLIDVSARFVATGMAQPLDYTQRLNDQILGTNITGEGHTTGVMDARLVVDDNHAAIRLDVAGRTDTKTVGRNRRVTVWGDGVTSFTANTTLTLDESGFSGGTTRSSAQSDNRARAFSAPPLIRRFAWRQIQRQTPKGNQIAARHAEPLINDRVDREAATIVESANEAYNSLFRYPLLRRGQFPAKMQFRTSAEKLQIEILQAAHDQIGAPRPAPLIELAHDVSIRMHETAVNNLAEALLAGRTLTDEDLRAGATKFFTMTSLEEFSPDESNEKPWSITFAEKSPISVSFRDGVYTLVIAGDRWASGRRKFRATNVTISYRIELSEGKVRLVRDEEILIAPPGFVRGEGRLSVATISLRRVLQRKLNELFPEVVDPEGLVVPGPWEKAGVLNVVTMSANAGWLKMSWRLDPSEAAGESSDKSIAIHFTDK